MNVDSTFWTAVIRSLYWAVGSAAFVGLTTWAASDDPKVIIVASGTAFLSALGFRGGLEGAFDAKRQTNNNVKPSDVHIG